DPIGTREMKDLILRLKQQGKTVVMCSHQLADVQDVCDRVAILYAGELKLIGKVDELLQEHDETQILTSSLSESAVKEIEQIVARHGAKMHKVDHPAVTLEELFLRIVKQSQERPGQRFTIDTSPISTSGDGMKPSAAREPDEAA